MRDYNRINARLETMGLSPLLHQLQSGHLLVEEEYNFSTLQMAKRVQALLYDWLFFYPEIKARTSIRLVEATATIYIKPRTTTEKRGRRKLV